MTQSSSNQLYEERYSDTTLKEILTGIRNLQTGSQNTTGTSQQNLNSIEIGDHKQEEVKENNANISNRDPSKTKISS